jgi:hypothetical protein
VTRHVCSTPVCRPVNRVPQSEDLPIILAMGGWHKEGCGAAQLVAACSRLVFVPSPMATWTPGPLESSFTALLLSRCTPLASTV